MITGSRGSSAAFAATHARLLHDRRFQFAFAAPTPPPRQAMPRWLLDLVQAIAPVMPYLFWGALALIVGGVLFAIGRELLRSRGTGVGRGTLLEGGLAPSPAKVRALLAEADRLAAAGEFGEAVHVLLFRTLEDIEARRPGLIGVADTSREIAALQALPAPARAPLARIAAAVERVVFAGRPADRADFAACRADYDGFLTEVARA